MISTPPRPQMLNVPENRVFQFLCVSHPSDKAWCYHTSKRPPTSAHLCPSHIQSFTWNQSWPVSTSSLAPGVWADQCTVVNYAGSEGHLVLSHLKAFYDCYMRSRIKRTLGRTALRKALKSNGIVKVFLPSLKKPEYSYKVFHPIFPTVQWYEARNLHSQCPGPCLARLSCLETSQCGHVNQRTCSDATRDTWQIRDKFVTLASWHLWQHAAQWGGGLSRHEAGHNKRRISQKRPQWSQLWHQCHRGRCQDLAISSST